MKANIITLITMLILLVDYVRSACPDYYSEIPNDSGGFDCVKCDTSCLTCSGPYMSDCITCPPDFTFDQATSYCIPPASKLIDTIQSSYKFYNFQQATGWSGGATYNCEKTTIYKSSGSSITRTHTLSPHYKLRLMVSLWWLDSSNSQISVAINSDPAKTELVTHPGSVGNPLYCANSAGTNIDISFTDYESSSVTVTISSASANWGIRQYIFIQYKCDTDWCSGCDGPEWDNCRDYSDGTSGCSDSKRVIYSGQCRCDPSQNYFKYPAITGAPDNYCVKPCPNRPSTGMYYGDPDTQLCVDTCPDKASTTFGITFADDISGECVSDCPTNDAQGDPYYHDLTNRRCVTNCPQTEPYKFDGNRTCLQRCPNHTTPFYYKHDKTMKCSTTCPKTDDVPLYKDDILGACVEDCEGIDWWADHVDGQCDDECEDHSSEVYFEDNTTTKNRCVKICPEPLYFGDLFLDKCIDHCYGGKFGDTHSSSSRHCVVKCSGGYYGLLTGNRQCVQTCPQQTWGQGVDMTCTLTPSGCDPGKYADNTTHLCVAKGACSQGQYSYDGPGDDRKCVIYCPDGTYADSPSMHCQNGCTGVQFADPDINKCVTTCFGDDLYSDVSSGNKCVTRCNQIGLTPYRDHTTKKCVNVCPTSYDLYSDPDAEECVYNCSVGRYKDSLTTPTDKKCVTHCPSPLWGSNTTGYGVCVTRCPQNPPLFGDVVDGYRVCVEVCSGDNFGDQDPSGGRQCIPTCPTDYFAQADQLRRCVLKCNQTTFGHNKVCYAPEDCPGGMVGDTYTNLCTSWCSQQQGLFADDIQTNLCVEKCPINDSVLYFADPTLRWCKDTCNATGDYYGNNDTQTCEQKCIDFEAFADAQHSNRYCIGVCTNTASQTYYRNNQTKVCVVPDDCQQNYFADNISEYCVRKCPKDASSVQTWGHIGTQTCIQKCYGSLWGDDTTGIPLCVNKCPSLPMRWSYDVTMLCVDKCPESDSLYGEDFDRTCVGTCPMDLDDTDGKNFTYSYDPTRRCLKQCPDGYYSDYLERKCHPSPDQCTYGWGDDWNNSCTYLCNGHPYNTYGDDVTSKCQSICTDGSWADNYTGDRVCVQTCAGTYDLQGVSIGTYDRYADNFTQFCEQSCVMPDTWADWQTHRCELRCSGDEAGQTPTYSENENRRCVIALTCPFDPDKLYGDNDTRSCVTACKYTASQIQWADNITRTCLPQCINWTDGTNYVWKDVSDTYYVLTRFYGDTSTNSPICVIACPQSPRLFGQNMTNRCVSECPDNTYGDQTGNRSCVDYCPNIGGVTWFTQITQQLCVLVCEDGTWGNYHDVPRPHCETVPTDCITTQYADNSTHLCVPLCPESQNYFGDPSTKLCVDRCPTLDAPVVNATAGINMVAGHLYADYSTRLCVYKCPDDFGPRGTFGDNETNTCVHRCPDGTFGDWQTTNRHCVTQCTPGTFADDLTNTCVSECPSSPPYFGDQTDWICVKNCPPNTWADATTRLCVGTCPNSQFKLSDERDQCIDVCPSVPDLYGDLDTFQCVSHCVANSAKPYADPISRTCKANCDPLFQYDNRCVHLCPQGYYADSNFNCVLPTQCDTDKYGDNGTTKCISPCVGGAFADPNSRYCIAVCPPGWYGEGTMCVQDCTSPASSSNITQVCESDCPEYTYHQGGECVSKCSSGSYANDVSGKCDTGCPSGKYSDPRTNDCVATCYDNQTDNTQDYFRDPENKKCVTDCSVLSTHIFKDFITGNCVQKCSPGYWGNLHNHTCIPRCITGEYGYETATQRTCYLPAIGKAPGLYGDPQSAQYVSVCPITPKLYYADTILQECKESCQTHGGTDYYGDPSTRQCQSTCQNNTFYTADPQTGMCQIRCTSGTYRFNDTPICQSPCREGFADNNTGICVEVCPVSDDTFGYHDQVTSQRVCLDQCPENFYSEYTDRTCAPGCQDPYFAYNATHQCVLHCIDSFADTSNQKCMDICHNNFADNSTNKCVDTCPDDPDYYGDDHVCVFYCTTPNYYADPDSRECVTRCPNVTEGNTYGDPLTGRCVLTCSQGYYADNNTNLCKKQCPTNSFAYNETRLCVAKCPADENLYGDPQLHVCAYTCSKGYGSQISQECIIKCDDDYWGDPLTTLCVNTCPNKIYSYGQNVTRTCVTSCIGYTGFADNYTRICRDFCHDTRTPETYRQYDSKTCVEICPDDYYMENSTNQCLDKCLTGYADNYSRYCVIDCPDNPQSYAYSVGNVAPGICVYECLGGKFSDNSTNKCVVQCPDNPDYFGDPHTGRCVFFCTEGTWGENDTDLCVETCPDGKGFADNLTRKCVSDCPVSEGTFADEETNRCLRVCSPNYWADNQTQTCVGYQQCPTITGPPVVITYADDISRFCVETCPDPYFGNNGTNQCVQKCSVSLNLFGHPRGRVCVNRLNCYPVDGVLYFADDTTQTCVQKCPLNRWADMTDKVCRSICRAGEFRDLNTQVCVTICPDDPDEYADTTTQNCVRTCPKDWYAVVQPDGNRTCVSDCDPFGLIKDNTTNRCVPLTGCATEPYMFGDSNLHQCVHHCSIGFANNQTQTCVGTCPADWQYFGDTVEKQCVSLCDNYLFADALAGRTCQSGCSGGKFADNQTSRCVDRCSEIKPFYYQDIPSYSCVEICPDQSYAYDFNQTCLYTTTGGVSTCPPPFFADTISRKCVEMCPIGYFAKTSTRYCVEKCTGAQFADPVLRACVDQCSNHTFSLDQDPTNHLCVQFCPEPYFAENSTHSCVKQCSNLLALETTRSCESSCPQPYYADAENNECVLDCRPKFADDLTRSCLSPCSAPAYSQKINYTCTLLCPENTYGRNGSRICQDTCDIGFADPYSRVCMSQCPQYPMLFADNRNNKCVPICTDPLFGYTENRQCVSDCPNVSTTVYLADTAVRRCVLECTNQQISFADYQSNQCTNFCPEGTFASNHTKQCVPQCPTVPNDTFGDNTSHICLAQCQNGYGDPDLLICVAQCTLPRYADPTTKLCVQFCPKGYFAQQSLKTCRQNCLPNTYADPSTHKCVEQCPQIQNLFKNHEDWTCVYDCQPGYFAKEEGRQCVQICESDETNLFAFDVTKQCVPECPTPYRGFVENRTCILDCPSAYFYNITRNLCTKCPQQCTQCTGPFTCLSCIIGYNLFSGICSYSCIPQNGLITYAHPITNQCVQTCPPLYFGENKTYTCTKNCPTKEYGNSTTKLCENCPPTCSICSNLTHCTACEGSSILALDNMCYSKCNSTHNYKYNGNCYDACPNGTYLGFNKIDCEQCASLCGTCDQISTNCTSCKDRYFYQGQCITSCPDGFYGTPELTCQSCTAGTSNICDKKLTFVSELKVENYKYVILLKFNQDIDIKKQLDQILKVKLRVKRRALQVNQYVNDGISFTYEILSNGYIKLYLDVEADLEDPVFDIEIVEPSAIVSKQTGASVQQTSFQLIPETKLQYYPPQEAQDAPIKKAAEFVVTFILVLFALSLLFTDTMIKPLQFLQLLFFHCLTLSPIPASLFFYLAEFKASLLQFLPNWLSIPIAKDVTLHEDSTQKTIDLFVDYNFVRNVGHIIFAVVIYFGFWIVFFILSNKRVVWHRQWHTLLETISVRRFRWSVINDIFGIFYLPILWFGFMQCQQLFGEGYLGFNGFFTLVCLLGAIIVPFAWFAMWWRKQYPELQARFPFMTNRLDKYNHKALLEVPISYIHLLLCSIWLVGLITFPMPQMIMLAVTNFAYMLYLIIIRPFKIHINTIFHILILLLAIALQIFIIYFEKEHQNMKSSQKTALIFPFLAVMSVVLILGVIWSVWRVIWQFKDLWGFFKKHQFYRAFGDPEIEDEKEISETYDKYEKIAQNVEATLNDIIVQNMVKQCNDQGQNVIKVKKKVLKKKNKPRRIKQEKQENNNEYQEEKQYVRINKVNPFDYDYDKDYKKQEKKDPMKRTFDDDLRDMLSDEDEPVNKKRKATNNYIAPETQKIDVDKNEKELKNIDELDQVVSENESKFRNTKRSELPFEFLDGFSELDSEKASDNNDIKNANNDSYSNHSLSHKEQSQPNNFLDDEEGSQPNNLLEAQDKEESQPSNLLDDEEDQRKEKNQPNLLDDEEIQQEKSQPHNILGNRQEQPEKQENISNKFEQQQDEEEDNNNGQPFKKEQDQPKINSQEERVSQGSEKDDKINKISENSQPQNLRDGNAEDEEHSSDNYEEGIDNILDMDEDQNPSDGEKPIDHHKEKEADEEKAGENDKDKEEDKKPEQKKVKGIEQLLEQEQENNKKKNLLFLFDEEDDE